MAKYSYLAKDRKGKQIKRVAQADSEAELISFIKSEGLIPVKINKQKQVQQNKHHKRTLFHSTRVKGKELALFARQLSVTLNAGVLLTEALDLIAEDQENYHFQQIINSIRFDIQSGLNLSVAMGKFPKIFPVWYRAIVRTGEATGSLHKTLARLSQYLEDSERLKEKVKSAVQYPMFVLGFAVVVVLVVVFFLIPKFASMYSEFHAELPMLTKIVVNISELAVDNALLTFISLFVFLLAFYFLSKNKTVKYYLDALKLRIPILGKEVIHKALISRYCRTLGFLLAAGVGLKEAFDITGQAVNHLVMQKSIDIVSRRVVSGASISDEMKRQKIFTRMAAKMVSVGERSGTISQMLEKTADYYDEELEITLANLTAMIEPVLIIFIGAIILVVVLALYLPIFTLSQTIK